MDRIQWLEDRGYIKNGKITHTRSTKFLLPLVGITEMDIEKIDKNLLINVHYLIKEKEIKIIVVLKLDEFNERLEYFVKLQNLNENFSKDFVNTMIDNDYLIIYNLPEQFREDFNLFIEGKYSKMSKEYKDIIIRVYGDQVDLKDYKPYISEVLYPTDIKRQLIAEYYNVDIKYVDEVSAKPNKEHEAFHTIEELKNLNYL